MKDNRGGYIGCPMEWVGCLAAVGWGRAALQGVCLVGQGIGWGRSARVVGLGQRYCGRVGIGRGRGALQEWLSRANITQVHAPPVAAALAVRSTRGDCTKLVC